MPGIIEVPVTAEWRPYSLGGHFWLLTFTEPCPGCGDLHTHGGGGDADRILLGDRVPHCSEVHKPFRDDCTKGRRCSVRHIKGYVLVNAS